MCVSQVYRLVPWRSAIIWLANTQTQKKLETYTLSQLRDIDSFFSILYSYCTYVYYACWNHCPCLLLQLTQSQVSFPIAPTRLGRLFSSFTHTHTHTISYLQFANPLTSHFPFTPFFFFFHLFLSCPYKRAAQETRLSIRWWCNVTIVLYLVAYRSTLYPTSGRLLIANQPIHILQDALQTHNVEYIGSLISM